jgi:hypothetical protein
MSISNVISFLKILNGIEVSKVNFSWPSDKETFREPWKRTSSIGVTSLTGFATNIPVELITKFSKENIIKLFKDGKFINQKKFRLIPK